MSEPIRTCIVAEDETLLRHALVADLKRAWPAAKDFLPINIRLNLCAT